MAGRAVIRDLREEDAAAAARLQIEVNPHRVVTPELVWHRASRGIEREQRREWVAEVGGEIRGCAFAGFEWSVPTLGKGRFLVEVHPERRGRGLGSELYARVEEYLRSRGAWRLRTWVDDDPAGTRFLERRGFEPGRSDRVSALDLPRAGLPEPSLSEEFRIVPLAAVRERVDDLFAICAAGELDMPGDEPEDAFELADWKLDDFAPAALSYEGSFVAVAGERPVSLTFLSVEPGRKLAYNRMTATLPDFRRRGLALAAKLAAARWAAANGIERIVTENDAENAGMLAINDRLGYRFLYEQVSWALERERAAGERG
jgi:GNAT superfamily N-acetyltransferase